MSLPDLDNPVFAEPWQAHAFALAVTLHQRGLFSWPEWAATLADEIRRAQAAGDPDRGDTYYHHWLSALERLVAEKGASNAAELVHYRDAWDRAAARTPHGQPIELGEEHEHEHEHEHDRGHGRARGSAHRNDGEER